MKMFTMMTTTLLLATAAYAAPKVAPASDKMVEQISASPLIYLNAFDATAPTTPQACTDAAFTADQQATMKNDVYQSERTAVTLKANLQLAMMDYGNTTMNTSSAITDAQTSETGIATAVSALVTNKVDLMNTLLYTVLTPDQRMNAIQCFKALEKAAMEKKLGQICGQLPK